MITEKDYLEALEIVKAYKKQIKLSAKRTVKDSELEIFASEVLGENIVMKYSDILEIVMIEFEMCRTYAVAVVKRLRDLELITQGGKRNLYVR